MILQDYGTLRPTIFHQPNFLITIFKVFVVLNDYFELGNILLVKKKQFFLNKKAPHKKNKNWS